MQTAAPETGEMVLTHGMRGGKHSKKKNGKEVLFEAPEPRRTAGRPVD